MKGPTMNHIKNAASTASIIGFYGVVFAAAAVTAPAYAVVKLNEKAVNRFFN